MGQINEAELRTDKTPLTQIHLTQINDAGLRTDKTPLTQIHLTLSLDSDRSTRPGPPLELLLQVDIARAGSLECHLGPLCICHAYTA